VSGVSTSDRVHPYPGGPELGGGCPQQLHQAGLRRGIRPLAGLDGGAADRGERDDAAPASLDHPGAEGPHHIEGGAEVERDDPVELGAVVVEQAFAHIRRGGEHDDVQRTERRRPPRGTRLKQVDLVGLAAGLLAAARSRSALITSAPCAASARADSRPIPLPAPSTTARLPSSRNSFS
jgi:hypothetical protein